MTPEPRKSADNGIGLRRLPWPFITGDRPLFLQTSLNALPVNVPWQKQSTDHPLVATHPRQLVIRRA